MESYDYDSAQSLLGIANRPTLQADDKPLFTRDEEKGADAPVDDLDGLGHGADGEAVPLGRLNTHKAVYNPASGRLFDVVTDDYEIINPGEFLGPLREELAERDHENVSGTVRAYDHGARCYTELLFDDKQEIYLPGRGQSNPVKVGFEIRWSHDGGLSVRVNGYAQDTSCTNSIREVTSPIHVKHAGDVDGRINWNDEWATALDELGAFSDALAGLIEESMEYTLFTFGQADGPFSPGTWRDVTDPLDTLANTDPPYPLTAENKATAHALYELLGFPRYLATAAAERLMARLTKRDDPRNLTAWDAYSGATWALTHHFRGDIGKADDDKHRTAKDMLLNPGEVVRTADAEARSRVEPDADQGTLTAGSGDADDAAEVEGSVGEALRAHGERERELAATFGGDE